MVDFVRIRPAREGLGLIHPSHGALKEHGYTPWPRDQFTNRRIKDRDVVTEAEDNTPARKPE